MAVPHNGGFIRESLTKMDDLKGTPISGNPHMRDRILPAARVWTYSHAIRWETTPQETPMSSHSFGAFHPPFSDTPERSLVAYPIISCLVGGPGPPLWKMMDFVIWDDNRNPILMGKCKKWPPNHQPAVISYLQSWLYPGHSHMLSSFDTSMGTLAAPSRTSRTWDLVARPKGKLGESRLKPQSMGLQPKPFGAGVKPYKNTCWLIPVGYHPKVDWP